MKIVFCVGTLLCFFISKSLQTNNVVFDDSVGLGRTFEGIGGMSAGATSKLLVNYPKDLRDQILDYLFKPNFGASFQILKVEIGGDVLSTDGSESSHMHNSWDENYNRGYEWWLMKEAKKRSPDIKLHGLPWGFPGWLGQGTDSVYANITTTADYIVRWINGAKKHHNLTIDYIGIWNERECNYDYVKTLRSMLDERGFKKTLIIAPDGGWDIAKDILKDPQLAETVYAIGAHYPGTFSSSLAQATGKSLWASEDFSTFNDKVGGGCWARVLNQNYVNGLMTATISWNLIASYYRSLPYYRDGLMTAAEPWSGNYIVESPIWLTAHTTQFSRIGWKYLSHKAGVGKLPKGGSYVSLVSPDNKQLTIVLETMTRNHSKCIRPFLPKYNVEPQKIRVMIKGSFAAVEQMNVWYSRLDFAGAPSSYFVNKQPLKFKNGVATLSLGLDEVVTLTTLADGHKGSYPRPPASAPFPLPYKDSFDSYQENEEPFNMAQQTGSFEVVSFRHNKVLRQTSLIRPVDWCYISDIPKPFNVIGNGNWTDIFMEIDFYLPHVNATTGVFVAARVSDQFGCQTGTGRGIFVYITRNKYFVMNDYASTAHIHEGFVNPQLSDSWHRVSLLVQSTQAMGAIDGRGLFNISIPAKPTQGLVAIGTNDFGLADFDNLLIASHSDGLKKMKAYFKNRELHFHRESHF